MAPGWVRAACDKTREVGHVDHQVRIDLVRDLRERREIEDPRIRAVAGDDHLRAHLERALANRRHVEDAALLVNEIRLEVIDPAAEADRRAVAQMAALIERHAEHGVAGAEHACVDGHVRLGAGMGLDVGVVGSEEGLGAVPGQVLDLVDDLTSTVVALPRDALGVLVVEPGAERLEDRDGREVLRRDQLEGLLLAHQLGVEQGRNFRIGRAQRGLVGESGAANGSRTDFDRCAGHCDLCPSEVVEGKPPRSERKTAAEIGPSRSTRGVSDVQSMIVEASPPQ